MAGRWRGDGGEMAGRLHLRVEEEVDEDLKDGEGQREREEGEGEDV